MEVKKIGIKSKSKRDFEINDKHIIITIESRIVVSPNPSS
jgi:hypothetical protein